MSRNSVCVALDNDPTSRQINHLPPLDRPKFAHPPRTRVMLPEIFQRTWGTRPEPFWPKATAVVHSKYPNFTFLAEVYWDLEWTLQQQGFAYCYDKRLYDRLKDGDARPVREHLLAGLGYQDKLARFLENHDEPRAAAVFPTPQHRAAAIVTFLAPGIALLSPAPVRRGADSHPGASVPRPCRAG